jgi:hypothetical protein
MFQSGCNCYNPMACNNEEHCNSTNCKSKQICTKRHASTSHADPCIHAIHSHFNSLRNSITVTAHAPLSNPLNNCITCIVLFNVTITTKVVFFSGAFLHCQVLHFAYKCSIHIIIFVTDDFGILDTSSENKKTYIAATGKVSLSPL